MEVYKAYEKVEIKILSFGAYQILLNLKEVGKIAKLSNGDYESGDWAQSISVLEFCRLAATFPRLV